MQFSLKASAIILVVCGFIVATPTLSWSGSQDKAGHNSKTELLSKCGKAEVGKKAPWLSGWTLDNQVFNIRKPLASGENRRLVLVFWATWCAPCREGLKMLHESAGILQKSDIEVVLVNFGEPRETIEKFFKNEAPDFPVVLDPYQQSSQKYLERADGKARLPVTALISSDGIIEKLLGKEGDDYIEHILAKD